MDQFINDLLYIHRLSLIGGYTKYYADSRIDRLISSKIFRDSIEISTRRKQWHTF